MLIIRPLFMALCVSIVFGSQATAADVNPKKASNLKSIEFGELVKSYMINANSDSKWNFDRNSSNIVWDSKVKYDLTNSNYKRSGYIRLNFDGITQKETKFENPKKVMSEAAWDIEYIADTKNQVELISLGNDVAGLIINHDQFEPFKSFIKQGITYKPVCFHKYDATNYSAAYQLLVAGKKPLYLIHLESAGAGGKGNTPSYDLFLNPDDLHKNFDTGFLEEDVSKYCLYL